MLLQAFSSDEVYCVHFTLRLCPCTPVFTHTFYLLLFLAFKFAKVLHSAFAVETRHLLWLHFAVHMVT